MAATNVMLNPLDPAGSQVEQMALERQRALAAALQQQSLSAPEGQMISGHYVAPSPMQYMAKIGQGLIGRDWNDQLDQKAVDYQRNSMAGLVAALGGTQSAAPQNAQTALTEGAKTGSVGPTMDNAARLEALPATAPTPQASTLNPIGMNPQLAARLLMADPKAYWQTQAELYKPTDVTKMAIAAGKDPRQANAGALNKNNYIAPVNAREGSTLIDPITNRPFFNAPNKEGIQYTFDEAGNPRANVVPGFTDSLSAFEEARKRGQNRQTLAPKEMLPTNTDGTVTPQSIDATLNGPQGLDVSRLTPQQIEGLKKADPQAFAEGVADFERTKHRGVGAPFGQKEGAEAAAKEMGQANAKSYQELKTQAAGAADRQNALDNIYELATAEKGTKYGPGTSGRLERLSNLNAYLPAGMAFGSDDTKNAQIMQKYVSNLAGQYMKALGGTGTDAQLSNSLKSIANPDMMNDAIKEVVPKLKALEAAVQAKANGYDAWLQQPGNTVEKGHIYEAQFRKAYDPKVYQLNVMPAQEQRKFIENLPPAEAKALLQKRSTLRAMGAL